MRIRIVATVVIAATAAALAQDPARVPRPRILGLSHVALHVSDLDRARAFYKDFLGFAEPYAISLPNNVELVWIKINDRQTVELFAGAATAPDADRLYHLALETDDAEGMRRYLQSRGVLVPPRTPVGRIGNANFTIKDPDGHTIEITQYLPDGWTARERRKYRPDTRVSTRLRHAGIIVARLDAALKFYGGILGFKEIWRGSGNGRTLSWVNLQVPDGDDYIEFMLYDRPPSKDQLGVLHHLCLEVPDVSAAGARLQERTQPDGCKPPTPPKTGINGKRQINYFDSDGTRVEIMEPGTVDGKPRPSSDAPPPVTVSTSAAGG